MRSPCAETLTFASNFFESAVMVTTPAAPAEDSVSSKVYKSYT